MNKALEAAQASAAVIAQLNAEMSAHDFNMKSLADAVGIDYNTFRRYMNGERELPMLTLWATLAVLNVPMDRFTMRAKERLAHG